MVKIDKVFIFNSPPNSGKDVVANYLSEIYGWNIATFKKRLIEITQAVYGISELEWEMLYTRDGKETPHWKLKNSRNGDWMSPRQALIYISEEVIKPKYGKEFFGLSLVKELKGGVTLIPDGGFVEEVLPVIELVGKEKVVKVSIIREGCSFEGDSRTDLDDNIFGEILYINNSSSLEGLLKNSQEIIVESILRQRECMDISAEIYALITGIEERKND